MMKRIIEKTDDGSATLFVPELNEHYHSTKGARTESRHIFINMGLKASALSHDEVWNRLNSSVAGCGLPSMVNDLSAEMYSSCSTVSQVSG